MHIRSIILADDDEDDCLLFAEALAELYTNIELNTVHNGEELMQFLEKTRNLPQAVFLDLNMPRKNGFECLREIRKSERLKALMVIIFSTSQQDDVTDMLYSHGAQYYIRKPPEFQDLKQLISRALAVVEGDLFQPLREDFVLTTIA